jgi:Lrp/AsnC family transcriptional regulator for asnA, asnC and gidA
MHSTKEICKYFISKVAFFFLRPTARETIIPFMDQHNNKTTIDEFDQKIIEALQIDGRRPFTKLAAELGISESSVRQRVAHLINTQVMQVVAVTNPAKLGYALAGMIGIRVAGERLLEIAEQISGFEEVTHLIICTGSFDLLAEVICQDNEHLLRFLSEKLYKVEGVQQTETFMYLQVCKQNFSQTRIAN